MRRAGDILKLFLDRNTSEQADIYHRFFTGWRQVVGERIAAHSEVKDIESGIVLIEVDHPGWIQMIQLKQAQFVETLRKKYPDLEIRGLRLQLPWSATGRAGVAARTKAKGGGRAADSDEAYAAEGASGSEAPPAADPLIRGALDRLGRAIEKRAEEE